MIEKSHHLITLCVYTRQIGPFMSVAAETGQGQILDLIRTAVLLGTNMVNHVGNKLEMLLP